MSERGRFYWADWTDADWRARTDEELLDMAMVEIEIGDFGWDEVRAELLSRLSAGNQQADKVRITADGGVPPWALCPEYADGRTHICCAAIRRQRSRFGPEGEPKRSG